MAQAAASAGRTLIPPGGPGTTAVRPDEGPDGAPAKQPATANRDTKVILATLAAIAALAWLYTWHQAYMMEHMDHSTMRVPSWNVVDVALLLAMWIMMMIAMMAPAVAPMTLAFAAINRRRRERAAPYVATAVFVAGYGLAWAGFSVIATIVQLALHGSRILDAMMVQTSWLLSAALFLIAGLYQWSSLKDACLTRCRSTDGFILSEWRDGALGAVVMGLRHGLYCIGCCAPLMALLFAGSVMDLRWVAGLTAIVTVEKLLPRQDLWRRLIGAGLIATAVVITVRGLSA
jgi:predicted metal-binding membrane protein